MDIEIELFGELLVYYDIDEFYQNRRVIRAAFKSKDNKTQYLYRMYIYSKPFINSNWKNYIWDYLHDDIKEFELASLYGLYKRKHRKN